MSDAKPMPFVFIWRAHLAMSDLSAPAKNVADKLSLFMSPEGKHAFPAVWKLVHLAGLSDSTVRRALKQLRDNQWIKPTSRNKGGRQISTTYDAILPAHVTDNGLNPLHDEGYWEKRYEDSQQRETNREKRLRRKNPVTQTGYNAPAERDVARDVAAIPCQTRPETLSETTLNPVTLTPRRFPEVSKNVPVARFSSKASICGETEENLFDEVVIQLANRRLRRALCSNKLVKPDNPESRLRWEAETRDNIISQEGDDLRTLIAQNPVINDATELCDIYEGPDGGNEYLTAVLTKLALEEHVSGPLSYADVARVIQAMLRRHSFREVEDAILSDCVDDWTVSGFESAIAAFKWAKAL